MHMNQSKVTVFITTPTVKLANQNKWQGSDTGDKKNRNATGE